jgi:preprotein translocase subunit SecD
MPPRTTTWFIFICVLVLGALYVVVPGTKIDLTPLGIPINREFEFRRGLDLRGGLQVLLEADLPPGTPLDSRAMTVAQRIVEQRVNALGLTEPLVQTQGERQERIVVELPGITDPEEAIATIRETGLLEFVYVGSQFLEPGTPLRTDCVDPTKIDCGNPEGTVPLPTAAPTTTPAPTTATDGAAEATGTAPIPTSEATPAVVEEPTGPIYHTVMTGAAIRDAVVTRDELGEWIINFTLTPAGSDIFSRFTSEHVGEVLAIVLDKEVISAPRVESAITGGSGVISGSFNQQSANQLALQLRYGALPVPLKVVESRVIGPTLGEDSLQKSLVAGVIGLAVVVLFMALYYRLPGLIANAAIVIYALVTLALFKFIPVTLTLAGIAGFLLSTGSALDANILIFERLKEELRGGRAVRNALGPAWQRAWPSIRDSNIATLIVCAILFWFGSSFGATVVKGFAATLFIGVGISLFTALVVTRTFLTLVVEFIQSSDRLHQWFGV